MIRNFIHDIATAVKKFANSRGYSPHIPEQVYSDLAWTGLIDIPEFKLAVPNPQDRTRIKNRIIAEKHSLYYNETVPVGVRLSVSVP